MTSLICPSSGSCPIYNLYSSFRQKGDTTLAYSSAKIDPADIIVKDEDKGYLCIALENIKSARARLIKLDPNEKEAFPGEFYYTPKFKHALKEDSSCALIELLNR